MHAFPIQNIINQAAGIRLAAATTATPQSETAQRAKPTLSALSVAAVVPLRFLLAFCAAFVADFHHYAYSCPNHWET